MALARCNFAVQDESGNIVDGASVEVREETGGLPLASIFSDRDGVVGLGNPFTAADGADAGFHVAGGAFKITATLGGFTRIWRFVPVGMLQEEDVTPVGAAEDLSYDNTASGLTATDVQAAIDEVADEAFNDVLVGRQLMYGDIINGTIAEANATNAVTFSLKTLAGANPSADDPVLICFRNATAGTGNYVYRTVTAALSLTISSGSTLGAVSATAFDVVVALFDDGGTIRLGAINPFLGGTRYYDLTQNPPIASSTAEGGIGAADSAKVWYTSAAVTSKAYVILAVANYASGLATAGTWNVSPTTLQLYGDGITLPGVAKLADTRLQMILTQTAAASSVITFDVTNAANAFNGTYKKIVIEISNLAPATDDQELILRIGTGGGPTIQSGGTDYVWYGDGAIAATPQQIGSANDTAIRVCSTTAAQAIGNAAGENYEGQFSFGDLSLSIFHPVTWRSHYVNAGGNFAQYRGGGLYKTSAVPITALQFTVDGGGNFSGTFALYGV